ncbi:MAG: D-tyrosyl-tRNA(Tyr) deacylase [Candidatus Omnitrophota bacterium]|nr:MAG: D-tyrosyl-tRNA(Tyr) deacylase [Candidatus Omnitrophota bacterium]
MKALVVRVNKGKVLAERETLSSIEKGIALFAGIEKGDSPANLEEIAQKVVNLRIFENEEGKMHFSVKDKNYQILCISNFTLCANTDKGRRPSFEKSMPKEAADKMFADFLLLLRSRNLDVKGGVFGAHMDIQLELDGPVNIILESKKP